MSDPQSDPKEMMTRTAMDVARELLEQPALFLEFDGVPGLSPTAVAVTTPRYTGDRSTGSQHDERNLKVGALRLLGASDREIEQACGVTRRTIPLILAHLEKTGRITPLKERLAQATGDNAERSNIALRFLLDQVGQPRTRHERINGEMVEVIEDSGISMELAAMIKGVSTAVGILTEKTLLLTGQATEIIETRSGAGRAEFEQWWKDQVTPIQATVSPATESASAATPPISEEIRQSEPARDGSDTATHTPESERLDEKPPRSDSEGGGGDASTAGGPETPMS